MEISQGEIENQKRIIARLRAKFEKREKPVRAFVDTYGCQQNEADSEKIRGMLFEMGCVFTREEADADIIVINTCAVREHAEMRILGNVGALSHTKKANKEQMIILCGCMVQAPGMAERIKKSYPYVDLVFGPQVLWRFPELLVRRLNS
ncbi:MAG: tRNA (N6-isopentenyl adenosine(37)-C2)-methylthiotransferase MiaB, partial [Oscillospiraceae bacterium]|nr:tRNA (N6-isopentenyl adenosine(37)-C2)-methylthiotransferase MiaB [Oscillospiraceae bacterium]